jgi:hypothetical protein
MGESWRIERTSILSLVEISRPGTFCLGFPLSTQPSPFGARGNRELSRTFNRRIQPQSITFPYKVFLLGPLSSRD